MISATQKPLRLANLFDNAYYCVKCLDMNIQTEKLDLIEWISRLNDSSIIDKLRIIKNDYSKSKEWWDALNKEEIDSINRGLKDFEEGRVHSHDSARNIYEKYL
jgi:predicted transcriptional regulator